MEGAVLEMTGELRDELVANDEVRVVDPRTVPVRFSTLKLMAESPAHYLSAVQSGYEESLSMRIGTGTHAILFGQPFVVWTGKTRNGKAWTEFETAHAGEVILSRSEYAKSLRMANAIRNHETASRLLFTGTVLEQRIDWEWQGRSFRSTPDAAGRTHCVDLKCLRSANPEKVKWQSRDMFYHAQASTYRRALNSTGKHNIKESYLVVVENKRPHLVTVLRFTDTALEAGDRAAAGWLDQLLQCEAGNKFPGYVETIVDLDVPATMDDFIFDDEQEEETE